MDEWRELAKYLWVAILGLIKILWDKQEERFKKGESKMSAIEAAMYTKEDAGERRDVVDATLEARRQDVISLHAKIDKEIDNLTDQINTVSRDMHNGFGEIKTLLIERLK